MRKQGRKRPQIFHESETFGQRKKEREKEREGEREREVMTEHSKLPKTEVNITF